MNRDSFPVSSLGLDNRREVSRRRGALDANDLHWRISRHGVAIQQLRLRLVWQNRTSDRYPHLHRCLFIVAASDESLVAIFSTGSIGMVTEMHHRMEMDRI